MCISSTNELPTLEELLRRRGIHKSQGSNDYQDYIQEQQQKGLKPSLLRLPGIFAKDMHLALGRTISVKRFWDRVDKQRA